MPLCVCVYISVHMCVLVCLSECVCVCVHVCICVCLSLSALVSCAFLGLEGSSAREEQVFSFPIPTPRQEEWGSLGSGPGPCDRAPRHDWTQVSMPRRKAGAVHSLKCRNGPLGSGYVMGPWTVRKETYFSSNWMRRRTDLETSVNLGNRISLCFICVVIDDYGVCHDPPLVDCVADTLQSSVCDGLS